MQPTSVDEARGLSGAQLDAIAGLERRVVAHDGGRLKLEWGALRERPPREVNDLLAWESGTLVGYCGIYAFGGEPELAGAVDPARRRGGIGSALLARALEHVATRGRSQVLLVTPSATPSGRRFAQAKGASLHHSEHHLTLPGPPRAPVHSRAPAPELLIRVRPGEESDRTAVLAILQGAFGKAPAEAGQPGPRD
ncbi:MAG: GNAT family N-acetyltransferase, partial [Acidimicrobiales bacterium]